MGNDERWLSDWMRYLSRLTPKGRRMARNRLNLVCQQKKISPSKPIQFDLIPLGREIISELEPTIDMMFYHCKNRGVIADVSWENLTAGKIYHLVEFFRDNTAEQQYFFRLKDDSGNLRILKTGLFRSTMLLSPMGQQEKEAHFVSMGRKVERYWND